MVLHIKHTVRSRAVIAIVFVAVSLVFSSWLYLQFQRPVDAADLRNFDAGNIMSDAVMSNKDSMSEMQIQSFLEGKNSCNNTDIGRASQYHNVKDGKFVCMAKETFGGESAAHIIWQAGQDYSINPQVLIVLLQKEQGLVTDTWPTSIQYNRATGYGCPDTAPCDTQYYGLKNQIRLSAALFRSVLNGGYSNYPIGDNYILYNPNRACGGSIVNIKNRATSALYRYTPYQPNQLALNAGYGASNDGCGAYGNRNFWLYFTDWFGNTQAELFTNMDVPRQLYTKDVTYKIDPATGLKTEDLPAGLLINFQQKTVYRNQVCLRTLIDTGLNKQMCVLEENLSELFTKMTVPRKLTTKDVTYKIDPATGLKTEDLPAGLDIDFVQFTNYYDNKLCLRTKTDQSLNKQMCVLYDNLYEIDAIFSAMDEPRTLWARKNTNKINPISLETIQNQTLEKDQPVKYVSKTTTKNGDLCLRTESNTETSSNMCVLYADLDETSAKDSLISTPVYSTMDIPRKLITIRDTSKIDAITRQRYDPLPKGLTIEFEMKTAINNQLCLRTKADVLLQKNSCVFYDDLKEIVL